VGTTEQNEVVPFLTGLFMGALWRFGGEILAEHTTIPSNDRKAFAIWFPGTKGYYTVRVEAHGYKLREGVEQDMSNDMY